MIFFACFYCQWSSYPISLLCSCLFYLKFLNIMFFSSVRNCSKRKWLQQYCRTNINVVCVVMVTCSECCLPLAFCWASSAFSSYMEVLVLIHASLWPMSLLEIFDEHWSKNSCFVFTAKGSFQLLPFIHISTNFLTWTSISYIVFGFTRWDWFSCIIGRVYLWPGSAKWFAEAFTSNS
jgi:hypothetical protein